MRKAIYIAFLIGIPCLFLARDGYSQGPPPNVQFDRATRETDRFGKKEARALAPGAPLEQPKIEEAPAVVQEGEKMFFVKTITLVGTESFPPEEFNPIVDKYKEKDLSLSDLDRLCKAIERDYLKKGVIAVVFVPEQKVAEGAVSLQVVEAHMGKLVVNKHKYFDNRRLHWYWQIPKGEIIKYYKMSRSIQMMDRNPDREVTAALHAGDEPGTTDIYITAKTYFPVHVGFSYDNDGSPPTGNLRNTFTLRHNNAFNQDDMVLAGYTFGKDFKGSYTYHNFPLSFRGATVLYGYSSIISTPKKDFVPFDMRTQADKISFSLHQDIYVKDEYKGEIYAEFAAEDKWVYANSGGTINRDRLRPLDIGGTYLIKSLGATATISPQFTQGLRIMGASPFDDPLLTRHAPTLYTKGAVVINTRTALPFKLEQRLKLTAQVASEKLNPSEELSMGGLDSIRSYPNGDFLADSGFITNLEILAPALFIPKSWRFPYSQKTLREETTPVFFVDYGYGERRNEMKSHSMLGVGAGIRMNFYNQGSIRLEWSYPLGDHPLTASRASQFSFSINLQDTLPREIARIEKEMKEDDIRNAAWRILNAELNRCDSPVGIALNNHLEKAKAAEERGDLKEAEKEYEKVAEMGRSLYKQAEEYVRQSIEWEEELKKYCEDAEADYCRGDLDGARLLWEKIEKEAKPKPLLLEY